ncbi:MAG TPA: NUDIX hydrolase [Marinilabiliaceae bacterium]|nr:NUDIX hydrolase [Marinilabiliaceae bacterium]
MSYTYDYPRPSVTVDMIICAWVEDDRKILLIKRAAEPFKNRWALPGGFVDKNEDLIDAAHRELKEETGLHGLELKQLGAFGKPGRDPRGHTISIVFGAVVHETIPAIAADDADEARWFSLKSLPLLAFDHDEIISKVLSDLLEN